MNAGFRIGSDGGGHLPRTSFALETKTMKTPLILAGALALAILGAGTASAAGYGPGRTAPAPAYTEAHYGGISIYHIARKLQDFGYWNIRLIDGRGRIYGFLANGGHGLVLIKVDTYTGYVVSVDRVYFKYGYNYDRDHDRDHDHHHHQWQDDSGDDDDD